MARTRVNVLMKRSRSQLFTLILVYLSYRLFVKSCSDFPTKVVFVAYGLLERPKGCAHNVTENVMVKSITLNYKIPHEHWSIGIHLGAETCEIDGVNVTAREASHWRSLRNDAFSEMHKAEEIDHLVQLRLCSDKNSTFPSICSQPFWRGDYTSHTVRNALRMFYLEDRLSQIFSKLDIRTLVVVYSADLLLNREVDPLDVIYAHVNQDAVLTTANNDADGYTDGFYFGNIQSVGKVLSSLRYLRKYARDGIIGVDYERVLKLTFAEAGLKRRVLRHFGEEFRDFVKVRASGDTFAQLSCHAKSFIDPKLCPELQGKSCFL